MEFNDYPVEEGKALPWKTIAIVGGGVLLAIVIIGLVIRMTQTQDSFERFSSNGTTESITSECDGKEDVGTCRYEAVEEAASVSGSPEVCKNLESDLHDHCVWELAREQKNYEICASLMNEEDAQTCTENILYGLALDTRDVSYCDKIEDEGVMKGCHSSVVDGPVNGSNCSSQGYTEAYCEMVVIAESANSKQDKALCNALVDAERRTLCIDFVEIDDPDFDGLESALERGIGTDPRDNDTDDDGFLDGDEWNAGYDPNGPGKLE